MKRETKKQLFAVFVLLIFMGSSIAYAVSVVLGREQPQRQELVSDKPFADSESVKYMESNMVVVDFYYSQNCSDCAAADSAITGLAQDLSGYLAVDKIDAAKYKSIADANEITQFPSFVLKGLNGLDTVSGAASKQELKSRICQLYAEPIAACAQ